MQPRVHTETFSESVSYVNKDGQLVKDYKKHHEVDGRVVEHVHNVDQGQRPGAISYGQQQGAGSLTYSPSPSPVNYSHPQHITSAVSYGQQQSPYGASSVSTGAGYTTGQPRVHTESKVEVNTYTNRDGHVVREHAHEAKVDGRVIDKDAYKTVDGRPLPIGGTSYQAIGNQGYGQTISQSTQGYGQQPYGGQSQSYQQTYQSQAGGISSPYQASPSPSPVNAQSQYGGATSHISYQGSNQYGSQQPIQAQSGYQQTQTQSSTNYQGAPVNMGYQPYGAQQTSTQYGSTQYGHQGAPGAQLGSQVQGSSHYGGQYGGQLQSSAAYSQPRVHTETYSESTVVTNKDGHYHKEHAVDRKVDGRTVQHEHIVNNDGYVKRLPY